MRLETELRQPPAGYAGDQAVLPSTESSGRRGTLTVSPRDNLAAARDIDDEPAAPAGRVVLASAPKIRAVYWCRFWQDALRPEFYKNRPVVIVSRDNRLDGPALVVPLTTKPQGNNKWAYKLTENPNPRRPSIDSWAVCNHIYAVSCARLAQMDGGVPRMKPADFDEVVRLMLRALPDAPLPDAPPGAT
jgi:mRNA interferase MazF